MHKCIDTNYQLLGCPLHVFGMYDPCQNHHSIFLDHVLICFVWPFVLESKHTTFSKDIMTSGVFQSMFTVYVNKWHIQIQWRTVQSKSMSITKNMWYFIKLINSFILFSATRFWRYCPKRSASSFKSGTSKDNTWWMDWNNAKEFSHPTMSDWVPRYVQTTAN